jgi:hypothetical protein
MNAQILRRLFLPLTMAAIVAGSVYATTGISSAASSPQPTGPAVVKTIPVVFTVHNKAGKIIRRQTGVAKVVRRGSAAARQAGIAEPDATAGPSYVCVAYVLPGAVATGPGGYIGEEFIFPSEPFIGGSFFNQTGPYPYATEAETQEGADVYVYAENNGGATVGLHGWFGVLYWNAGC